MSEAVVVPPQQGRAVWVTEGSKITVTDVEGKQVGDVWALLLDRPFEPGPVGRSDGEPAGATERTVVNWLSTGQTRHWTGKLFPVEGDRFYTYRSEPILSLLADRSPGPHDMFYPPCDPELFEDRGLGKSHPSCRTNFEQTMANAGIGYPVVPEPVNIFQNSPADSNRQVEVLESLSRAGDSIEFKAHADLLFVLTSCSIEDHPINGLKCTPLQIDVDG